MRTPRWPDSPQLGPLTFVALAGTVLLIAAGGQGAEPRADAEEQPRWQGLVADARTRAMIGQRTLVVLRAPAVAQYVARAGGRASEEDQRRWRAKVVAGQKLLLSRLALEGLQVLPEFTYTRVLNGFSAPLDAQAIALLERQREVAGVYPVRATYPAAASSRLLESDILAAGTGHRPELALAGFDGRGVTIALLDTGVDAGQPFLRGRLRAGVNLLNDGRSATAANTRPDDPTQIELHGTQLAGIVAGNRGPAGLRGVAPGASLIPIRVAGWQREEGGSWAVYGRTDQLVAGLERAVDPNGDGAAHDAARIALVGVVEPFAAFGDGPLARAVAGATQLDTLVVAPAGNDGPAGPAFGSISGPGGAADALTVGAADLRRKTEQARVVVRSGLQVEFDGALPLAGAVAPERPLELGVALPRKTSRQPAERDDRVAGELIRDFFDDEGFSRVAGRAVLVAGGARPRLVVRNAARAGAAAVLLDGRLPAGGLGLDASVGIPAVSLDTSVARRIREVVARRRPVSVLLGAPSGSSNPRLRRIAGFSSRGLTFDGRVKPEVAAPGVAVASAEPGSNEDRTPRFATVNGSSVAAAIVAGAAALLAQARPAVDAPALKSLLVGSAKPLPADSVVAQGAGLVDLGAAAAAELATSPVALTFGSGRRATRPLVIRNVSSRPLRISFRTKGITGLATSLFSFRPKRLRLAPGRSARVRITVTKGRVPPETKPLSGWIQIRPLGGAPTTVPWLIAGDPQPLELVDEVSLSAGGRISDTALAVLSFRAGRVLRRAGADQLRPVARLDVELWAGKRRVGVLARMRNLLPGRYAYGLTGRGPGGRELRPGVYRLRLVAIPPPPAPWSATTIRFRIT